MKITDTIRSTAYESVTSEKKSTKAAVKQKKKQQDTFELSGDTGVTKTAAGGMSASSDEDELGISKKKGTNSYVVTFGSPAYVYRAVARGYITVNGVQVQLSDDVKKALTKQADETAEANERSIYEYIARNNAIVAKQQGDAMEETADDTAKAMRIMARIASGKRVPMKDKEFLMKYDPKLYGEAESIGAIARMHKKKKDDKVEGEKDDEEKKPKEDYNKEMEDLTISHTNTTLEVSLDGGEATAGDVSSETIE